MPNLTELTEKILGKKWRKISSKIHLAVNKSMYYIAVILPLISKLDIHTRIPAYFSLVYRIVYSMINPLYWCWNLGMNLSNIEPNKSNFLIICRVYFCPDGLVTSFWLFFANFLARLHQIDRLPPLPEQKKTSCRTKSRPFSSSC